MLKTISGSLIEAGIAMRSLREVLVVCVAAVAQCALANAQPGPAFRVITIFKLSRAGGGKKSDLTYSHIGM
jgi:hypothetical protein